MSDGIFPGYTICLLPSLTRGGCNVRPGSACGGPPWVLLELPKSVKCAARRGERMTVEIEWFVEGSWEGSRPVKMVAGIGLMDLAGRAPPSTRGRTQVRRLRGRDMA
jgi:hypothetical protein